MKVTEKRFTNGSWAKYPILLVMDNKTGEEYNTTQCIKILNQLNDENEQLKNRIDDYNVALKSLQDLTERKINENEQLKEHIKSLEKQCVLLHIKSMFSTVKSFNGDISKRYKYSEKTDTIYDTANKYGKYDKILDKKKITMLLNEYETILKELKE